MADDLDKVAKRLRFLASLLKEATSEAHDRLEASLLKFATERGFSQRIKTLPNDSRPDVLQAKHDGQNKVYLFVGDAKVSANETPRNAATLRRIRSYVHEFAELIRAGDIAGGFLAIATDDIEVAKEWATTLSRLCADEELSGLSPANSTPNFRVEPVDESTFVTVW